MAQAIRKMTKQQFREAMAAEIKRRLFLEPNDVDLDINLDQLYDEYREGTTVSEHVTQLATKYDLTDAEELRW